MASCPVQSHAVVEAHDVVGDVGNSLVLIGVVSLPDTLRLEAQEEALYYRIVPAVDLAAHAADQAVARQHRLMQRAGVLTAPVGMND